MSPVRKVEDREETSVSRLRFPGARRWRGLVSPCIQHRLSPDSLSRGRCGYMKKLSTFPTLWLLGITVIVVVVFVAADIRSRPSARLQWTAWAILTFWVTIVLWYPICMCFFVDHQMRCRLSLNEGTEKEKQFHPTHPVWWTVEWMSFL